MFLSFDLLCLKNVINRVIHVTHTKNCEVRGVSINETLTKVLKDVIGKIQNTILMYLLVTKQENHIQTSRPALLMQQRRLV